MINLTSTTRLLFIGDSITDCDRRNDPAQLGHGYVRLVRDWLCVRDPKNAPVVINRGISGNKMPDLQRRWQRDVLNERPDVLSIFIGVNDVWHALIPGRDGTSIDDFVAGYRDILSRTRAALPNCTIVLCEPSVIWPPVREDGNAKLRPYVTAVREAAREFDAAALVPLHAAFNVARDANGAIAWTIDGVHPTSAGHLLIARTWLATTNLI
jgi:lysophospholipase L1-like esterase